MTPSPDDSDIISELAKHIVIAVDRACRSFVTKIEGGTLPPGDQLVEHGRFVDIDGQPGFRYFIWKKHNVLCIRYGTTDQPAALVFCHLYPDDWPEPLAYFISELP